MIIAENLSFSFPEKELYNKISFILEEQQHCALIGASGTGKSTLADLIMHPDNYLYDGKLRISPDFRIGYASQFPETEHRPETTVFEYLAAEFVTLQQHMTDLCTAMETAGDPSALLDQYQQILDHFDTIGGHEYESSITKTLNLAGLNRHEQVRISQLSGGEAKLIQVIKAMLVNPDLLIMDEPDVFLDFERLNALRDLINSYKGMVLVITHNRFLLHHCFNKIIHLENTALQEFDGTYADYHLALLQRKIELQEQSFKEAEEIERNQRIVGRMRTAAAKNISASLGRAVHARATHLKRLEARRIEAPFVDIKQPEIHLMTEQPIEDTVVLKVTDYSAAFDELLLEHVSFELRATDKAALIGPNGTGKTTLLRDIFNNHLDSIALHKEIKAAFLSQLQGEMLDESASVSEQFDGSGFQSADEIRTWLSGYGFHEELLHQQAGALSGGERNLLQLAKIAAGSANLLLLDEPTSHLDTYSQIALEKAVKRYNGAVLMVSHDFYTIANCVDYVLLIEDRSIRKISSRKFRKMIYANHFDKNYLALDEQKKELETRIGAALQNQDFVLAKELADKLEGF